MKVVRDPASLTEDERLREVALLLAVGYLRLALSRQKALEVGDRAVALMSVVNEQERPGKDDEWNPT